MSEKTSRILLILEAILIAGPLTILALIYTFLKLSSFIEFPTLPYVVALAVLALFSVAVFLSGWRLFVAFLHGGSMELKQQHPTWWILNGIGIVILFGSILSRLLPPSPEYSMWWSFRLDYEIFALCIPLLIPFSHLAAERFLRKYGQQ